MKKGDYGNPNGLYLSAEGLKNSSTISDLSYRKSMTQTSFYYEAKSYLKPFHDLIIHKITGVVGAKVCDDYNKAQSQQYPPLNLAQYLAKNDHILQVKQQYPDLFDQYNHIFKTMMQPCYDFAHSIGKVCNVLAIDSIVSDFKVEYPKTTSLYFDVADKSLWQNGFPKISCKENLIEISDDIFHKIEEQSIQLSIDNSSNSLPIIEEQKQGMTELEKALARIKELEDQNNKKDIRIKELEDRNNEELFGDLKKNESKDKIIEEQSYTISDLRKDKIELRLEKNEWKTKCEVKDNSLQKMIEELTVEKAKVSELTQKIGVHNHDGSSSWIKLEQEEIFNAGEGGLENESFD